MSSNQQELTPEGVLSTVGYGGFVKGLFSRSGDQSKDFTHAILGVATELRELKDATDGVNALEEAGDIEFYTTAAHNLVEEFLGVDTLDIHNAVNDAVSEMLEQCVTDSRLEIHSAWDIVDAAKTELLDRAKRWVGYGKQPDLIDTLVKVRAVAHVSYILANTLHWREQDSPSLAKRIELANVAKLLHRYRGLVFNAENAINRNVGEEREILEAHAV